MSAAALAWTREDDGWRRAPIAAGDPQLLVVLLHGVGSTASDLAGIADVWAPDLPTAAFASLSGTAPFDSGGQGRQWFSLKGLTPENRPGRVAEAYGSVQPRLLAERTRWGVPASRLVLVGFSQGSIMSLRHAAVVPEEAACVVAYSGRLAAPVSASDRGAAVTLVHGTDDRVIPASESVAAEAAFRAAGRRVEMHILQGLGHGMSREGIRLGLAAIQRVVEG